MGRPSVITLIAASLAAAATVPITMLVCITGFVIASATEGFDSRSAIGIVLISDAVLQVFPAAAWLIAGVLFILFPAMALVIPGRFWFRSIVLMSLGSIAGAMIASHVTRYGTAEAEMMGVLTGLAAGGMFAFVCDDS